MFGIIITMLIFIAVAGLIMWVTVNYEDQETFDDINDEETWRKHGL